MSTSETTVDELDRMISLVQTPTGDAATRRLAAEYRAQLVARGAEAEDRIVALIEAGRAINLPALFDLLAAFGTPRAMQILLVRLIAGPEGVSHAALSALAAHPTPAARGALRSAAQRDDIDPGTRALVLRVLEKMGASQE